MTSWRDEVAGDGGASFAEEHDVPDIGTHSSRREPLADIRHSDFVIHSSFVIRYSSFAARPR